MTRFNLHQTAEKEGRETTFCCATCLPSERSSLQTFRHLGFSSNLKPGYCTQCSATGFLGPRKTCSTCSGTGICSNCDGKPYRTWNSLPQGDKESLARTQEAMQSRQRSFSARVRYFRSL